MTTTAPVATNTAVNTAAIANMDKSIDKAQAKVDKLTTEKESLEALNSTEPHILTSINLIIRQITLEQRNIARYQSKKHRLQQDQNLVQQMNNYLTLVQQMGQMPPPSEEEPAPELPLPPAVKMVKAPPRVRGKINIQPAKPAQRTVNQFTTNNTTVIPRLVHNVYTGPSGGEVRPRDQNKYAGFSIK